MNDQQSFFATVPLKMESLLVDELKSLGASQVKEARSGVSFKGNLELAYRVCLWSRIANRILLPIAQFPAETPEALYDGIRLISWEDHVNHSGTIAVDFNSSKSKITHTKYGALKVKDGIVDYFRDKTGIRPSVDLATPDIQVNIFILNNEANVSIDLSGGSLHRRGYRIDGATAPLKENLAAAILIKSGWQAIAQSGGSLIDPMCGSGTLPIEAALIAADSAPGLIRSYFGFLKWNQHDEKIWETLIDEAEDREIEGFNKMAPIVGYDSDLKAIQSALQNLERVGLTGMVHFEKRELTDCIPTNKMKNSGLLIINPPYGERLGVMQELKPLYSALGNQMRTHFEGWNAGVLTGNPDLGKSMGIRAQQKRGFFNGTIQCELLQFDIRPQWYVQGEHALFSKNPETKISPKITSLAEPFVNRIKKNIKKLQPWLKKDSVMAYRVYDRDLPEFAVAVDIYGEWVHVQEYEAPKTIDAQTAQTRLQTVVDALPIALNLPTENIFLKIRKKQKGAFQYEKLASEQKFYEIAEYGCQFLVNFTDYLDTGLFIDHRLTRKLIKDNAKGKHFLNLFAYTGSATVYAAKGGAKSTTSVDLSKYYLDWAQRNMSLNGFSTGRGVASSEIQGKTSTFRWGGPPSYSEKHKYVVADCLEWLEKSQQQRESRLYDLIFLDPPTFSNSKKMKDIFDIQQDHGSLINKAMKRLAPNGLLIFSTNFRKFKLDHEYLSHFHIEDWTHQTLPPDFQKKPPIHQCWKITHHNGSPQ